MMSSFNGWLTILSASHELVLTKRLCLPVRVLAVVSVDAFTIGDIAQTIVRRHNGLFVSTKPEVEQHATIIVEVSRRIVVDAWGCLGWV